MKRRVDRGFAQPVFEVGNFLEPPFFVNAYLVNGASNDMGVDGSVSPVTFSFAVSGHTFYATRLLIYMEASAGFTSTGFFNLAALANGVQIRAAGQEIAVWKDNIDVLTSMYDATAAGRLFAAVVDQALRGRWTFVEATSNKPLIIENTESFEAIVRDDLSAAGIIYRIRIQGWLVPTS